MKKLNIITIFLFGLTIISCEQNETFINRNPKSVTDCTLNNTPLYKGICFNGAQLVSQNEILTYTCKATTNFSEIIWTIEEGNIEILNTESNITSNFIKSIATIRFNDNFTGGSLNVKAVNNKGELAEISDYKINLED